MSKNESTNFIIAGVPRAGTTSLFAYLSMHPDVCPSRIKETRHFLPLRYGIEPNPIGDYRGYFSHCRRQRIMMEASPGYLYGGARIAEEIKRRIADPRIIVCLREPVDRLISSIRYHKSRSNIEKHLDIEQYVGICESLSSDELEQYRNRFWCGVEEGRYSKYLKSWIDTFGDSLKVVFFDSLISDGRRLLSEICEWLDIEDMPEPWNELTMENRSMDFRIWLAQGLALKVNDGFESFWRRHPKLKRALRELYYAINGMGFREANSDELHESLRLLYLPHNRKLANQIGIANDASPPEWLRRSMDP